MRQERDRGLSFHRTTANIRARGVRAGDAPLKLVINENLTQVEKAERLKSVRDDAIPGRSLSIIQEKTEDRNFFAAVGVIRLSPAQTFRPRNAKGQLLSPRNSIFVRLGSTKKMSKRQIAAEFRRLAGPALQKYGIAEKDVEIEITSIFDRSEE